MIRRLFVLVAVLLGSGLLLAAPALAHASVVSSDPADGSRLNAVPRVVTITFDENVGIGDNVGYLHVTDENGRTVDAGPAFHPNGDGSKVSDTLRAGLHDGTYTESFRVISADSHPVAGTIRFVVGNGTLVHGSLSQSAVNETTSTVFDVVRWISYAGLALLGGAWLLFTIWPAGRDDRRATRIVWTGWTGVLLGGVLELLIQGPYAAGDGLGKLADWALLDGTLHTDYGQLHCARLVLLGLLALVFGQSLQAGARPARWESVAGLIGIGVVATFSGTGHASTTSPAWLSMPLDALHLIAMATWLGGLVMLIGAVLPRREPDELQTVLPRFSTVAFVSVVVLAGSGTYAAFRGIGTVDAVFTTTYGLLVMAKVLLFLGILALGNVSRRAVQRSAQRSAQRRTVAYAMTDAVDQVLPAGGHSADAVATTGEKNLITNPDVHVERLRRAVFVEVLVGVVVLAVTAVLVAEPRGKEALVASYRNPISAVAPLSNGQSAVVTADPGTHGQIDITVELTGGATAQSITATATEQAKQIGPLPITLTRRTPTTFDGSVALPIAGPWDVDLVVTSSELDAVTTDTTIHLH